MILETRYIQIGSIAKSQPFSKLLIGCFIHSLIGHDVCYLDVNSDIHKYLNVLNRYYIDTSLMMYWWMFPLSLGYVIDYADTFAYN